MNSPLFLPWLRRGLARGIGGEDDPAGGVLPLRGSIETTLHLTDSRGIEKEAKTTLAMVGPGDVVGLDSTQIVRNVPADRAVDVESNYFPFVELAVPDLPWILTPAQATAGNVLRPWLVLVCVEQRDGVEYDAATLPLPVLRLSGDVAADELPDLAESWAWVHVQSMVRAPDIEAEVEQGTGAVTARLMCPRRLLDGRTYRALIVPAFDVGRAVGLGEDVSDFTDARPAWDITSMPPTIELPVYFTWTFSTSTEPGDFEELARRLQPDLDGGRMGYRAARIVDTGLLDPFKEDTSFEYEGTLVDPGSHGASLKPKARAWFHPGMTGILNETADRLTVDRKTPLDYNPEVDDPILGPPLYGSWAADHFTMPTHGWLNELNLHPSRRAAAGLGSRVVREHQHEFLAAAWDQASDVQALQEELNRGRLAAEVGRSVARRMSSLEDNLLLQVTARLQVFVPIDRHTVAKKLERSVIVPRAMTSPAFVRQTRPAAVVSRRAGRAHHETAVGTRAIQRFVAASVPPADRVESDEILARFGTSIVGVNTVTFRTSFELVGLDVTFDDDPTTDIVAIENVPVIKSKLVDDITGVAMTVRDSLDPMPSIVTGLDLRITGVALDPVANLPTRMPVGPRFTDPLFLKLHAMGSDLVLPGIDVFETNRVRLVEVNEGWIAAFLAGANHEWAREALWNEYPADLGATAFSTFWPRIPPGTVDLSRDMHEWHLSESLANQVGSEGASTVLLVRGDLIRRYPEAEFMLVTPEKDGSILDDEGNLPPERTTWPAFTGYLDPQTIFVGFDVDPQVVWEEGRFIGIQEAVTGPRFGLDIADPDHYGQRPQVWAGTSWGHLAASAEDLDEMNYIRFTDSSWLMGPPIDNLEWARNGAHLAGITFQQPFRLLMPASYLMPQSGGST